MDADDLFKRIGGSYPFFFIFKNIPVTVAGKFPLIIARFFPTLKNPPVRYAGRQPLFTPVA